MNHRICPTTGKRMLKRQEADRVVTLAQRAATGLAHVPLSAYRCPHCRKWHNTGMSQLEYRVREMLKVAA